MEKIQILFPQPQLDRLRNIAAARGRPVSELVRVAVAAWLERQADSAGEVHEAPPVYHCGDILVSADSLRDAGYETLRVIQSL